MEMAAEGALELSEHLGKSKVVSTFTAIVEGKQATEVQRDFIGHLILMENPFVRSTTTFSSYVWPLEHTRVLFAPVSPKQIDSRRLQNLI
jgi:hypothetical protein